VRLLVTGGAGFIGSHLVDRLVADGHEVAVVDNLASGRAERVRPPARLHPIDLRDRRLAEVLEAERPEVVFHQAAQTDLRRSVADPVFDAEVNVLGSVNLLEASRRAGVRRVVFASSGGAIYGETETLPTPEDHPTRPASPYGVAKLAVEHYLACWQGLYGIGTVSLRYANVYGPRQDPFGEAGVVAIFAHRMLGGEPPLINGDGEQTRDYVYVDDVVEANLHALERPEVSGPINIGTGIETTVNVLFHRLRELTAARVPERHGPPKAGEQRRSGLDPTLAKRLLGWSPRVGLVEGLARTVESFRRERDA